MRGGRIFAVWALVAVAALGIILSSGSASTQTGEDGDLPLYWEVHAVLLSVGTLLFVGSYAALWLKLLSRLESLGFPAITTRISRLWYRWHVNLGIIGVALILSGVLWGYLMVDWAYGGAHLRVPHSYAGAVAGAMALVSLLSGWAARRTGGRRESLRWWHIALGFASIVIMLAGLVSGLALD